MIVIVMETPTRAKFGCVLLILHNVVEANAGIHPRCQFLVGLSLLAVTSGPHISHLNCVALKLSLLNCVTQELSLL